ncbi:hypothetical protein BDV19DRAFT_384673 [Aspergillus venezuelensis]
MRCLGPFPGRSAECEVYEALGSLPYLRTLLLDLQYDSRLLPNALGDEEASAIPDVETLMNAAIDESLVTTIWHLIASSQPSQKLRNLRCKMQYVFSHIAHSLLVKRDNLTGTNPLQILNIGGTERELMIAETIPDEVEFDSEDSDEDLKWDCDVWLDEHTRYMLDEVWPGVDRREWWHSFQLGVDETSAESSNSSGDS